MPFIHSPHAALRGISTLILAAGHGAADPGACAGVHTERAQTIRIVDLAAAHLRPILGESAVVIAPHSQDTHETIPWINARYKFGQAWALEIHRDSAGTVSGDDASLRCGIYHGPGANSSGVASALLNSMRPYGTGLKSWARPDTASNHGRLGWIRQVACFSHLVEMGFMQGRNDDAHLAHLARILAGGLAHTLTGTHHQLTA